MGGSYRVPPSFCWVSSNDTVFFEDDSSSDDYPLLSSCVMPELRKRNWFVRDMYSNPTDLMDPDDPPIPEDDHPTPDPGRQSTASQPATTLQPRQGQREANDGREEGDFFDFRERLEFEWDDMETERTHADFMGLASSIPNQSEEKVIVTLDKVPTGGSTNVDMDNPVAGPSGLQRVADRPDGDWNLDWDAPDFRMFVETPDVSNDSNYCSMGASSTTAASSHTGTESVAEASPRAAEPPAQALSPAKTTARGGKRKWSGPLTEEKPKTKQQLIYRWLQGPSKESPRCRNTGKATPGMKIKKSKSLTGLNRQQLNDDIPALRARCFEARVLHRQNIPSNLFHLTLTDE